MKQKRFNICLVISFALGLLYSVYGIIYWINISSGLTGMDRLGADIAHVVIAPHLALAILAAVFNALGVFTYKSGLALTGAILYTLSALAFPPFFYYVVLQAVLSYIAFAQMRVSGKKR